MSSSRRYTPSGSRPVGRDKSRRVTDIRTRNDDEGANLSQHAQIVEDSIVEACCDHAHAVARVHGAEEVMLEHLVHALARVPEAAEVLNEQGYDVDHIRRESAAIIASDIPVGTHDSKRELFASNDFNTVLHLAAANTSRRGEIEISVWELLEAISGYDDQITAVHLLNHGRSGARQQTRREALPNRSRGRHSGEYDIRSRSYGSDQMSSFGMRSNAGSDELLAQGLAAIETALSRQNETRNPIDPGYDEKFDRLENRLSGLVDHRDREIKELKELISSLNHSQDNEQTKAVHADLIALREAVETRDTKDNSTALRAEIASLKAAIEKRDEDLCEWTAHLEQQVDGVKDDVGTIIADPQTGLRDEIRALSEQIDGADSGDISKLSNNMDQRFVNMQAQVDTRQGEILGLHSSLGQGVDEQGARLRGLEARLKDEHDETQGELRAIRGFLEKIAGTVDHYAGEIDRLRLDHIGDMSVINNQLEDIGAHINKADRPSRTGRIGNQIGGISAASGYPARPSRKHLRPKKSSTQKMAGQGGRSAVVSAYGSGRAGADEDSEIFDYKGPVEKKLVIDAETTQHVARRFARKAGDNRHAYTADTPRGSSSSSDGNGAIDDNEFTYRGQKIRRTRSSAKRAGGGQSLRERLVYRGAQIKDQYKTAREQGQQTLPKDKSNWSGRFWDDVKSLFRDDDPRWTDWRK